MAGIAVLVVGAYGAFYGAVAGFTSFALHRVGGMQLFDWKFDVCLTLVGLGLAALPVIAYPFTSRWDKDPSTKGMLHALICGAFLGGSLAFGCVSLGFEFLALLVATVVDDVHAGVVRSAVDALERAPKPNGWTLHA